MMSIKKQFFVILSVVLSVNYSCCSMHNNSIVAHKKYEQQFIAQKQPATCLHMACIAGDLKQVQQELSLPHCFLNRRGRVETDQETSVATPLFYASKYGHTHIVELLLKQKEIDVNKQDFFFDYGTPLHVAANMEIAKLLVSHGADVNAATKKRGQTPLITHTINNDSNIVFTIADCSACLQANHKDSFGKTALSYVLEKGISSEEDRKDLLCFFITLLPKDSDPVETIAQFIGHASSQELYQFEKHVIPVLAVRYMHVFSLMNPHEKYNPLFLLQDNAALLKNLQTKSNMPRATQKHKQKFKQAMQQLKMIFDRVGEGYYYEKKSKIVCRHGRLIMYDPTYKNFDELFGKKHMNYVHSLLAIQKLYEATKAKRRFDLIYTKTGATTHLWQGSMDNFTWCGKNIIEYAFKHENDDVISFLFEDYSADIARNRSEVKFCSRFNPNALKTSPFNRNLLCVNALKKGLFKEFMHAIFHGNYDEANRIVQLKVDINEADRAGNTPLHIAAANYKAFGTKKSDDKRFVRLLIRAGAKLDERNCKGQTPLCLAILGNNEKIVHLLLKAGATVNCFYPISYMNSPLCNPIAGHKIALIKELIENGFPVHPEYGVYLGDEYSDDSEETVTNNKEIESMLQEAIKNPNHAHNKPHCHMCLKYCVKDIPCINTHKSTFICNECYRSVQKQNNRCPICSEDMQQRDTLCA